MKKAHAMLFLVVICLILQGCSVRSDAADLYKKEKPLEVEMVLPESISSNEEIMIQASLTQDGKPIEDAGFVHFEIWKQDRSVSYPMKEAKAAGNGTYQMAVTFKSDGLYVFKVHAGTNDSLISPQMQFVVGELSDTEMEALKKGPIKNEGTSGHHH